MESKIKKMRERLAKQRQKIAEIEAEAADAEQEIKKAEEEQLGYLARSAASTLSGGMDEVFELLRGLRAKPEKPEKAEKPEVPTKPETHTILNKNKEGESDYGIDETESELADEAE